MGRFKETAEYTINRVGTSPIESAILGMTVVQAIREATICGVGSPEVVTDIARGTVAIIGIKVASSVVEHVKEKRKGKSKEE